MGLGFLGLGLTRRQPSKGIEREAYDGRDEAGNVRASRQQRLRPEFGTPVPGVCTPRSTESDARICHLGTRGALRCACRLFFAHLRQGESGANCDNAEHRMRRIAGQAQGVHPFPRSNAHIGRIQVGALLCELEPPLLGALLLFECEALGVSPDELRRGANLGKLRFVHGQLFEG